MRRFIDDDAGYLRWLAANPDGYVINAARTRTSGPLVLHHASCRTINGVPSRGTRWTGPYIKLCGDRDELKSAVRGEFDVAAIACGLCLRDEARPAAPSAISRSRTTPHFVAGPAVHPTPAPATPAAEWPTRFLRPAGEPIRLPLAPRLASLNRTGDPDQLRLEQFLAATAELIVPRIENMPDPLALRLDVALARSVRLLDSHDLDNYLYPLATRLTKLTGRQFATVRGTKAHRTNSLITVDTAIADTNSGSFTFARLCNASARRGDGAHLW
jgi:hypothetical protein